MKKETRVTHPPETKLLDGNVPVVTPVYRTVKFTFPTIESSLSSEARESGFDYTRDSNPTTREVELTAAALQDRDGSWKVDAGGIPGAPATYVGMCHIYADSVEAFQKGFGPHAQEIMGDIANYTDLSPVIQISEVVVGQ